MKAAKEHKSQPSRVLQSKGDNSLNLQTKSGLKPSQISSKVIQGHFNTQLNFNNHNLSQSDHNKLAGVLNNLANFHINIPYEGDIAINIVNDRTTNPATTTINHIVFINGFWFPEYTINLQLFYIKMSSVGEILGLITHELGVHSLADIQTGQGFRQVQWHIPGPQFIHVYPQARVYGLPDSNAHFIVNVRNNAYHMNTGTATQADHVNAVNFGQIMSARAAAYLGEFLRIGDAIPTRNAGVGAPTQEHQDYVKTFLFDIARILVTNDGGMMAIGTNTGRIANAMWDVYNSILMPNQIRHPWINGSYQRENGFQILKYLLKKAIQGVVSNIQSHQ